MSGDTWMLDKDLCRCCHSEGKFKNLVEPCLDSEKENYADMIKSCFDIDLAIVPGVLSSMTYCICDACVTRIRDACRFKRRIQECDQRFMDYCSRKMIKVEDPHIIDIDIDINYVKKEEPEDVKEEDSDNYSLASLHIYDDPPIEEEGLPDDDDADDIKSETEKSEKSQKPQKTQKKKPKKAAKPKATKTTKKKGRPKKMAEEPMPEAVEAADDGQKVNRDASSFTYIQAADGDKYYLCKKCPKTYKIKRSARIHYSQKHTTDQTYKKRVEKTKQTRRCHLCDVRVPKDFLERHLADAHGIPLPTCGACGKQLTTAGRLLRHQRQVHLVENKYVCKICDKSFYIKSALIRHSNKHTGKREFACEYCKKSFKYKDNLTAHIKAHLNQRNKKCPFCKEAFVQKASLNYHIIKRHPNKV